MARYEAPTPEQFTSFINQGLGYTASPQAFGPGVGGGIPGLPSGVQYRPTSRGGMQITPQSQVWTGWTTTTAPGPYAPGKAPTQPQRMYEDYTTYRNAPTTWDQKQLSEFVNRGILNKISGFSPDMGMPEIVSAWDDLVVAAMGFNSTLGVGNEKWTPWNIMDTYSNNAGKFGTERRGDWIYDIATGKPVKYVGPTSRTTKQRDVDLSSPEQVQAIATQALREMLGRNPTDQELAQFRSSINAMERQNPLVTTVVETLTPDLATGQVRTSESSRVTEGGVTDAARAQLIGGKTEDTKEYGKYQSGTTYFGALMEMISGGSF